MRNIIRKLAVCFLAWILVCTTVVTGHGMHTAKAAQTFKIHFIDVGCADAALLQYGEGTEAKYALIDTGANQYHNTKDTTIDTTKTPVYEYLNKMGVKHLEFILLTHPHQDHIGGMEKILSDTTIKIDKIYGNDLNIQYLKSSEDKSKQSSDETNWTEFDTKIYKNFKAALEARNKLAEEAEDKTEKENLKVDYVVPTAGETISLGEAKMTFYGPLENDYQYGRTVDLNTRQENKYSIVTKIVYGSNSFLMTGDAQKETIEKIIAKGYDLTAQVLKEPHHGFQDVTEEELANGYQYSDHKTVIDASQASIAIISNGYMNTGGVPYTKVLRDLSKLDVYETGDRGTIIVTSDGSQLSIQTEKGDNQPSVKGKESDDETSSRELSNGKVDEVASNRFIGEPLNVLRDYLHTDVITDKGVTMKTKDGDIHYTLQEVYQKYGWHEGQIGVHDWDNNGKIDDNDKQIFGCTDPKWMGSLTSTMNYKDFDLSEGGSSCFRERQ